MPPATPAICLARGPRAQLAGAKSSLAFNVISRTANKASAYSAAWTSAYLGVAVDHDRQLLAKVRRAVATRDAPATHTRSARSWSLCPDYLEGK